MKKHISKNANFGTNSDLVFRLNEEVNQKISRGEKVINAAIGMLVDDENKIFSSPVINHLLERLVTKDSSKKYIKSDGGYDFNYYAKKYILDDQFDSIKSAYFVSSVATMGGTGALSIAVRNYVENHQKLIIPSIGWSNFGAIAKQYQLETLTYNLFKEHAFDIDNLLEICETSINESGRATLIINDPCHNPTGYCLNEEEWEKIIHGLNRLNEKGPVTLILDVAYMDFSDDSRLFFRKINEIKMNFMTLVAWSASKSFGVYGYRLGALLGISQHIEDYADFNQSSIAAARTTWSVPNHLMIDLLISLMQNPQYLKLVKQEFIDMQKLLSSRLEMVKKDFSFLGEILPYKAGFFLLYEVDDAIKVSEQLKEKNIYVLPLGNRYIRVSICSYVKK